MNEVQELSSVTEALPRPRALAGAPALIERLLPAQKLSAEAQKERKAVAGQTLTALGSYWKGRKPLILARACILGALLPATDDPEADLAVFEKLMAIDDEAFLRRRPSLSAAEIVRLARTVQPLPASEIERWFGIRGTRDEELKELDEAERWEHYEAAVAGGSLRWRADCPQVIRERLILRALSTLSYTEKVGGAKRPEEIDEDELYGPIWDEVNRHLGISARSFPRVGRGAWVPALRTSTAGRRQLLRRRLDPVRGGASRL
jgi:putative DNA methylase